MRHLILLLIPATLAAQKPLTYESFGQLFSIGDFSHESADGLTDLIIINKDSGIYSTAFSQPNESVSWSQPTESGFTDVSGLNVERFESSSYDSFAATSPIANRVTFWSVDITNPNPIVRHLFPSTPQTNLITGFPINPSAPTEILTFGQNGTTPTRELFESDNSIWFANPTHLTHQLWTVHHDRATGASPKIVYLANSSIIQAGVNGSGLVSEKTLPGFTANPLTRMTYGFFDGTDLAHLLFFKPETSVATITKITTSTSGWSNTETLDFPKPLETLVTVLAGTTSRLVALYSDHSADLFNFDGEKTSLITNLNGTHDLIAPFGENRFLSKQGDNWQIINATTGEKMNSGLTPSATTGSNILFVSAEPFTNPASTPISSAQVGNWTIKATGGNQNWTISSLSQTSNGLSSPTSQEISTNPGAPSALLNQFRSDVSVSLINSVPGPNIGEVFMTPNGGIFQAPLPEDPQLTISVSFSTTLPNAQVYYRRTSADQWTLATGALNLALPSDLQVYAEASGIRTPTRIASFTLGSPQDLSPGSEIDANNNGISDQWEVSFGISDPLGDPDGDGNNNLTEFQNGTDPADNSSFIALPTAPLDFAISGSQMVIRWPAHLTNRTLQQSPNLQTNTWSNVTNGISQNRSFFEYPIPSTLNKSFFRLR